MVETSAALRRVAGILMLSVGGCAAATPPAPVSVPREPGPPAASVAEAAARAALTPPASAARSAAGIALTGTELGTMWTFENPPLDQWERAYGFRPTPDWLEHARLASVKIPGCSASFVSEDGLILTNHHCARGCVASNSTPERDYVTLGFYAPTRQDEKLCPNAYADVLTDIEDVTARVNAAASPQMSSAELATATQRVIEEITGACQRDGRVCRVVSLFRGGQYQLYTYTRHMPVKLVMAPELQAGFFGGDYDNFVYPRYALDFAFYRAYEADGVTPVKSPAWFPFDPTGPDDGEAIFVTGNPGSTARLITVAQLMYERSYRHPMMVSYFQAHRRLTGDQLRSATGAQMISLRERLFGIENSLKKYEGEVAGLMDSMLVARKLRWESEFRDGARTAAGAQEYHDVWDRLFDIQLRKLQLDPVLTAANPAWLGSQYLTLPASIITLHRFAAMPEDRRPQQLRGEAGARFQASLLAPVPDEGAARAALEAHLSLALQWLPPAHALRTALEAAGATPADAARRLASASRILDPAFRRELVQGDSMTLRRSADPVVRLAVLMDSMRNALAADYQALMVEEAAQNQRLARALFAVYGTRLPPDATSTLRISDGIASGYAYNGTMAPYRTVFHGMFARSAEFGNVVPFDLPPTFHARRKDIDMNVPMDFVSTNDITGGNSGSPIIDTRGHIVGLAFDGNVEQLPNEYVFRTDTGGRTVAVHAAGILEALRNIYRAQALLDELLRSR